MRAETKPSFAFLVLTLNHQDYILEHLESIKYLVQSYGLNWEVDLIVNDDASRDETQNLVDRWIALNSKIFRHVKTLYNPSNLGTCASVDNMLSHMVADRCKITAGDDVYSFENIFELTAYESDTSMVSGRALYLVGDGLDEDRMANVLATATQVVYQKNSLLHRFKHLSYNNAPNILYATHCLLNASVRDYLRKFDVVEDWPLQVAIAREYPMSKLVLIDKVLVYYRRTLGSTYIVVNQRFMSDKNKLYLDLIDNEINFIESIRLSSRRYCFNYKNFLFRKILNLDAYFFLISILFNFRTIQKRGHKVNLNLDSHREHFIKIKCLADAYLSQHLNNQK